MPQQGFNWNQDLIEKAEKVINKLEIKRAKGSFEMVLTVVQLRKVLSLIVAIKNKLNVEQGKSKEFDKLPEDVMFEIKFLKPTLLYQAGRIEISNKYPMRTFVNESELLPMIASIGDDVQKFDLLCRYVEALAAFYKYRTVELKMGNVGEGATRHGRY